MGSDFLKSVSVLFSGNILANIISFAAIPLISRIYSKADFGEYAIFTSVSTIIVNIVAFGLTAAIMAPKDNEESKKLLTTISFVEIICISVFTFAFVLLFPIGSFTGIRLNRFYISALFVLYTVFMGIYYLLSVYTNKLKLNRVLFWNALINSLSVAFLALPLGFIGLKSDGLIIAAILSFFLADCQMAIKTRPFVKINLFKELKNIFQKYRDFVFYQFPSNLIGTFAQQYPNQAFSRFFGNANLGGYAMCERILGVPMRLIGSPINTVYFRHASMYVKEGRNLSAFTFKLICRLLLISYIPVILLYIFSHDVFVFILGREWETVGALLSVLVLPYFMSFCCSCITYCLVVINKQKINLVVTVLQLSVVATSISLGYYMTGNFTDTIKIFAYGNVLVSTIHLLIIFYFLKDHFYKMATIILSYLLSVFVIGALINGNI